MSDEQQPVRRAVVLSHAAWTQLGSVTQAFQAAVLRGDQVQADQLRIQAHDLLDSHLDLNAEAAHETLAFLGG